MLNKLYYLTFTILFLLACSSNDNQKNTTKSDSEVNEKLQNMFISQEELDLLTHPENDPFYKEFGGEYDAVMQMGQL